MAHRAMAGGEVYRPAALDGGKLVNLHDDRGQTPRLWMHLQGVSPRSRAEPESLRRDASLRPRDRGRAARSYRGSRSWLSPESRGHLQVWSMAYRQHLARLDNSQVSL